MYKPSAGLFASYDMKLICEKPGTVSDDTYIYAGFFGQRYRVRMSDGLAERIEGDVTYSPAGFRESMILYDIMAYSAPDAEPSGEYTVIQNLSNMHTAVTYAGYGMFEPYEKAFDGKTPQLTEILSKLGGEPFGKGDVSFRITIFGNLKMVFSFWNSDDEFPPSLKLLFDRNTTMYMHYETVWYVASHILNLINGSLNGSGKIAEKVKRIYNQSGKQKTERC